MKIRKSTRLYDAWLSEHIPVVEADVHLKHQRMAESPFYFMRATFYRWAQVFPSVCEKLAGAPSVLAVGDLHIENFGTWRDAEGRLVWGVNDFDEAYPAPYTNDLVRLIASAALANEHHDLPAKLEHIAAAVIDGYVQSLERGGEPFVLSERHDWLRTIAESELRDPVVFWRKMRELPPMSSVPKVVQAVLRKTMPSESLEFKVSHRVAGLGSLGRPRYVAVADWQGGEIAREIKALAPSAWVFAQGGGEERCRYQDLVGSAVRAHDPFLVERGGWITRRLSPHCSRVELEELTHRRDELRLMHSMGWEVANVHMGTRGARKDVRKDLEKRHRSWLVDAALAMKDSVVHDWKEWRAAVAAHKDGATNVKKEGSDESARSIPGAAALEDADGGAGVPRTVTIEAETADEQSDKKNDERTFPEPALSDEGKHAQ